MALKGMTAICFLLLIGIALCIAALIRMGMEMEKTEEERDWYKRLAEDSVKKIDEVRRADNG